MGNSEAANCPWQEARVGVSGQRVASQATPQVRQRLWALSGALVCERMALPGTYLLQGLRSEPCL